MLEKPAMENNYEKFLTFVKRDLAMESSFNINRKKSIYDLPKVHNERLSYCMNPVCTNEVNQRTHEVYIAYCCDNCDITDDRAENSNVYGKYNARKCTFCHAEFIAETNVDYLNPKEFFCTISCFKNNEFHKIVDKKRKTVAQAKQFTQVKRQEIDLERAFHGNLDF